MNDPKAMLRQQLRTEYADLDEVYKKKVDTEIIRHLQQLPCYKNCSEVYLFASTGNEVYTHDLIRDAFSMAKTVFLPKCRSKGIMEFYNYDGALTVGKYGICEPTGMMCGVPKPDDLMIVPGLAFTAEGLRLGQGGGYYDRYLEKHPCVTVGLCRDRFLKKELPTAWNDLPVDYVITETAVYTCKNGAS